MLLLMAENNLLYKLYFKITLTGTRQRENSTLKTNIEIIQNFTTRVFTFTYLFILAHKILVTALSPDFLFTSVPLWAWTWDLGLGLGLVNKIVIGLMGFCLNRNCFSSFSQIRTALCVKLAPSLNISMNSQCQQFVLFLK